MAIKIERTVVGNVGKIYELRQVGPQKKSVVDFSIASTPRRKNAETQEWEDGETIWSNCTAWGQLADNIVSGWAPGDHVFAIGRIEMKSGYTNNNGEDVPPRENLTVEFAGHENSRYPSTMTREKKAGAASGNSRPAAASKPAAAKKPVPTDDELVLDNIGGDDDLPF